MKKKLFFGIIVSGIIFLNIFVMSESNDIVNIRLDNLLKLNTANAQTEIGEVTVKPGQNTVSCKRLVRSEQHWSPIPPFYTVDMIYTWGTIVHCTEKGSGCSPHECNAPMS